MKITKYNEFRNISGNKLRELRKKSKMSQQDLDKTLILSAPLRYAQTLLINTF